MGHIMGSFLSALCRPPFQDPIVSLKMMWIQSITRKGATLNFRLSIYNPNTFPLEIKSLTYKASKTSDGVEIASGKLQDSIFVLAEESGVANASVVISFGGLGAASKSIARRGKTGESLS